MSTPPRDLADAHTRLTEAETALAALIHENNELRTIIRCVRDHAHLGRALANGLYAINRPYEALPYETIATALERIIGDQP